MKKMENSGENTDLAPDDICIYKYDEIVEHIVCIPASNEVSLLPVLESLNQMQAVKNLGVCIVINASENAEELVHETNRKAFLELNSSLFKINFKYPTQVLLYNHLPNKKAGVGLARKLAMDSACVWLKKPGKNSILLCLDADCKVDKNWANSILQYFNLYIQTNAVSVYFEHEKSDDETLNNGIEMYELHLRYLKNALKWAGYPWYFHTVGSSMALRAESYVKSGGMNTRQAGEDYYFLHKLMPLGFGEINTTVVRPATRYSDRVPFGTGRSMLEYKENQEIKTYHFGIFRELKAFFSGVFDAKFLWKENTSETLTQILIQEGIEKAIDDAVSNSANEEMAVSRFKKWFSGFRIIRIMHALRSAGYFDVKVETPAEELLSELKIPTEISLLGTFRKLDRGA